MAPAINPRPQDFDGFARRPTVTDGDDGPPVLWRRDAL